ncbi:MAG: SusD/RagB family nutrient-binding outer membrane lipoprotein, partial [Tannerellaceae bacterium]
YAFFRELDEAAKSLMLQKEEGALARFDLLMPEQKRTNRQWLRFANSLRLRLAIRIAKVDPIKAREEASKSLDPNSGGLLEAQDDLVAVSALGTGYSNPLGEINKSWGEVMMNANMESILTGYKDPRLPKYFETATGEGYNGQYHGIRQGTGFNHIKYSKHSRSTISQTTSAILMPPAEVWFLRAEAAMRGWSSEQAANCYSRGVQLSFTQWAVGDATDYLESDCVAADFTDTFTPAYNAPACCKVSPKWDEQASNEVKLEKIITQKWIACYPEGCEAWAEQRRTGYPRLFPVLVNKSNGKIDSQIMIRRLNFPVGIITANPAQYEALCRDLGGVDTGGTRLWWDVPESFIQKPEQ